MLVREGEVECSAGHGEGRREVVFDLCGKSAILSSHTKWNVTY